MYGQNRNSGIYRLGNYAQAMEWFNRTPPIRGKGCNAGVRPLGHRNRPHFQILKGEASEVICKCYQTNVVTFMPSGVVKIDSGGYMSQTTANFIKDVLGIGSRIEDRDIIICVSGKNYRVGYGLELRIVNDKYEVTNAVKCYVHSINRKVMKKLREEVAPFMQYLAGSIKVRGSEGFSEDEKKATLEALGYDNLNLSITRTWRDSNSVLLAKLLRFLELAKSKKVENWYLASCWFAWAQSPWVANTRISYETIAGLMDTTLIATNRNALIKTEVPEGEIRRDRYASLTRLMEAE